MLFGVCSLPGVEAWFLTTLGWVCLLMIHYDYSQTLMEMFWAVRPTKHARVFHMEARSMTTSTSRAIVVREAFRPTCRLQVPHVNEEEEAEPSQLGQVEVLHAVVLQVIKDQIPSLLSTNVSANVKDGSGVLSKS